jgi:hypothetical protein
MKKEIIVTGKNYGYIVAGVDNFPQHWLHEYTTTDRKLKHPFIFLSYLDGRDSKIALEEQFGWEDGCRSHQKGVYRNPRYIPEKSYHGNASSLSKITLEVEWTEDEESLEKELEAVIPF